MSASDMKETIMATARPMVQARGYNSLSFRELATAVGIKSASIHYYFPTKDDLGAALARRYTDDFLLYLNGLLETKQGWKTCIALYADVFRNTLLRENRMCLGGILAAERPDLALAVRTEVERFTTMIVEWLGKVVALGHPKMEADAVQRLAYAIFAAIEGAQLVARGCDDVTVFDRTLDAYRSAGLLPALPA